MKKVCALFLFCVASCFVAGIGRGQLLFEDNFNYPAGDSLRGHGWNITGTSVVNPVSVTLTGLSYTGYPSSGIGNGVTLNNTGQDVHDTLTSPATSGSVYASLLVRVTAAQASDYFFHLTRTAAPTTDFYARTFVRLASNSNLAFGIQKGAASATNPVAYTDSVYSTGITYLLVVKYVFNTGTTTDDQVSLFVFSDPTLPSSEPTPTVGPISGTQTDVLELGLVALRQGTASTAPTLIIDGIRVGLTWNDAPLPIQLSYFRGTYSQSDNSVQLDWRTISEVNNYGFFVQRSSDRVTASDVSSLIPGHGTTNVPHDYAFTDLNVPSSNWYYRLKQVDLDGSVYYTEWIMIVASPTSVGETVPKVFALQQNYPNPFNPETHIKFSVEKTGRTSLRVFDLVGQEVALLFDEVAEAGKYYDLTFKGTNLTSGVYFYKLESGNNVAMKKLMLLK